MKTRTYLICTVSVYALILGLTGKVVLPMFSAQKMVGSAGTIYN